MRWLRRNEDLERELEAHLELEAEEQADSGLAPDEARYAARRAFGNVTSVKEDTRRAWGWMQGLDAIARDLRFALRTFRRGTGAYVFAIVVLAVGIGMTTALFSLVHAVLLQPLPFPNQNALRVVWKALPGSPYAVELAYAEVEDLTEGIDVFESVAVLPTTPYANGRVVQGPGLEPVDVDTAPVSPDFFRTLGVTPMLGQDFPPSGDDEARGPTVILSHDLWRGYFSADRSIIGRKISIDGRAYGVRGVMGPSIDFPRRAELWLLLSNSSAGRGGQWLQAIARVVPGTSDEQVSAQLRGLFKRQAEEYPQFYPAAQEPVIKRLTDYWTGSTRLQLLVSLGSSFLLLIAACITAGNLFLSRAFARRQEIATRTSLGATARQVFSQFAVEGLAAGMIAGTLGLAIAWALIELLVAWAPAEIPRIADAGIHSEVIFFAASVSLLTALACSLAPTWLTSRLNAALFLREGGVRLTGGRGPNPSVRIRARAR
ncbi:MAG: ABC transporter permease [Acidobacteria bacterium]|nr:ABC transporter permease [Acidobacteriota bacterium]MDA1235623.1 ABC transporter permease [Acidobacteriota bacterium]